MKRTIQTITVLFALSTLSAYVVYSQKVQNRTVVSGSGGATNKNTNHSASTSGGLVASSSKTAGGFNMIVVGTELMAVADSLVHSNQLSSTFRNIIVKTPENAEWIAMKSTNVAKDIAALRAARATNANTTTNVQPPKASP